MISKAICIIYLLIFSTFCLYAQRIEGQIKSKNGLGISNASVLIKKSKSDLEFSEYALAKNDGSFSIQFTQNYHEVVYIEFRSLNFESKLDSILLPKVNEIYRFSIEMHEKDQVLDEVIIEVNKRFEKLGDTTRFYSKAFKDGTERNVEDVLRKIPGIELNEEDGSLKYLGKKVEAVQLDGDDLFGFNYAVGTRNISADMIDQVEAIDNFNRNPLMLGMVDSKTTAINLKLKKGRLDLSKTEFIGIGMGDRARLDLSLDAIAVSTKSKSYGTISYNNTGLNSSSSQYFSDASSSAYDSPINEINPNAPKIIGNKSANSMISERRSNINDQKNISLNTIYKINEIWNLRANLSMLKDELYNQEIASQKYLTNQQDIEFLDQISSRKRPTYQQLDLKLSHNLGLKRHVEFESGIGHRVLENDVEFIRNRQNLNISSLNSKDVLWTNKLDVSQRHHNNLFQLISQWGSTISPQDFNPISNFSFSSKLDVTSNFQSSYFSKSTLLNKWVWVKKMQKFRLSFDLGLANSQLVFRSYLSEDGENNPDFENDNRYTKKHFFQQFSILYELKTWKFSSSINANQLTQSFQEKANIYLKHQFSHFLNGEFTVNHDLSIDTKLSVNWKMEHLPLAEQNLFLKQVVNQNRSTVRNDISMELQTNSQFSIGIRKDNLNNGINQNWMIILIRSNRNFISDLSINSNISKLVFFRSPQASSFWNFNYQIDKYLYDLQVNINHNSNFSMGSNFNKFNSPELRENKQFSYVGSLAMRTMQQKWADFENRLTYQWHEFFGPDARNRNISINNSFKIIVRPVKMFSAWIIWDYYLPDIQNGNDFSFIDLKIERKYNWKKPIKFSILAKNMLNHQAFQQVSNTSFSTTVFQNSLIPGYWMIAGNFDF